MSTWTVGKKLYSGFGAMAALLIILGGASIWVMNSEKAMLDTASQVTAKKLDLALQMEKEALNAKAILRRVQLAGYANDHKMLEESKREADQMLAHLNELSTDISGLLKTAEGKKSVADAVATAKAWAEVKDQVVSLVEADKPDDARILAAEKANPLVDKYVEECGIVAQQQRDFLKADAANADATYNTTWWMIMGILLVAAGISVAVVLAVRTISNSLRQMATELRQTSEQVVSASTQVSTAAQSLSQGATEQAASLEESSA